MPLYTWQGITLQGELCSGSTFAPTYQELELALLEKNIGLTQARSSLTVRITQQQKEAFFMQLASLLLLYPYQEQVTSATLLQKNYK